MTTKEIAERVLLAKPTAASMGEIAVLLLTATQAGDPDALAEEISAYLSTLNDLALSWMAEGKHEELDGLGVTIRNRLDATAKNPRLLSGLCSHEQLTIRLDVLIRQIAQLLRGDNLARYLGLLSGKRREAWRELLLGIYDYGKGDGAPVRRSQAHEFCRGEMRREAAEKAVDKMAEIGLLTKSEAGPKNVQFQLTWAGRRVAEACLQLREKEDPESMRASLEALQGDRMLQNLNEVGLTNFEPADVTAINGF